MKKVISAFKEHKEFKKDKPWDAVPFTFEKEMTVPPHYAETIEILIYSGDIIGDLYIGGQHFSLSDNQVYFVAPNIVHSMYYKKNNGKDLTLKINLPQLKSIFDIDKYLAFYNVTYSDLPVLLTNYEHTMSLANSFKSGQISDVIVAIIDLFKHLIGNSNTSNDNMYISSSNEDILSVISWTEKHFKQRISLADAAKTFGYTKPHFCRKFKATTGTTYLAYLNHLRIFHACKLLKSGMSINSACDECGFDDISYFIQLFKKITGTTPKKYINS